MIIIDVKGNLHDKRILSVIALSQYRPTAEKLASLARKYEADENIFSFACDENGSICGVIVLRRLDCKVFEILSIASDPAHRNRGIASKLISFAVDTLKCSTIKAETDDDAVGFYRKCGFHIISLGEKYPGTVRYLCTLKAE